MEIKYLRGSYRGIKAQQNSFAFDVIKKFLLDIHPSNILELGTGRGALSLFIHDVTKEFSKFLTIDKKQFSSHNVLAENGISQIYCNMFEEKFLIDTIKPFIQLKGTTIVFCDDGNKIREFNVLSNFLKEGDFILAHDYAFSEIIFNEKIKDKVWGCFEITNSDIQDSCERNCLIPFKEDEFNSVAWTCRKKMGAR